MNINSTLIYIISFLGITALSFGITFGALSTLTTEDSSDDITAVSQTESEEDSGDITNGESNSAVRTESFALNNNISVGVELPEGWTIQEPHVSDQVSQEFITEIKSPEIIAEDETATGVHFCLAFNSFIDITPERQTILDTGSTIQQSIEALQYPAITQVKALETSPDSPFVVVVSEETGYTPTSYLTLMDDTMFTVIGSFGCSDNPGAANFIPSAEEFADSHEFKTAVEIISSSIMDFSAQAQDIQGSEGDTEGSTPAIDGLSPANPGISEQP